MWCEFGEADCGVSVERLFVDLRGVSLERLNVVL